MTFIGRNPLIAARFRDLRHRADVGMVTPPPSVIASLERTINDAAAEQLQGAVDDGAAMRALLLSIRSNAVRDDLDLRATVAAIDRFTRSGE